MYIPLNKTYGGINLNLTQLQVELGKLIKLNLRQNGLRQLDLAEHLQLTTSAVSQIITGKISPRAIHFKRIVKYLRCSDEDISKMKDLLIQIRSGMDRTYLLKNNSVKMPVVSIDVLLTFCPALEDLKTFVNRNSKQKASSVKINDLIDYGDAFEIFASGYRFEPPFPGSINLVVDAESFPKTTDIVLVKSQNSDKLQLKRFVLEDSNIHLMPFNGTADKQELIVDNLEWMRKVLKVTVECL